MKKCLLCIDNGTQSLKIALYDEEFDLVAVYTAEQFAKTVIPSWAT